MCSWTRRLRRVKERINDDDAQSTVVQRLHFAWHCNNCQVRLMDEYMLRPIYTESDFVFKSESLTLQVKFYEFPDCIFFL